MQIKIMATIVAILLTNLINSITVLAKQMILGKSRSSKLARLILNGFLEKMMANL